MTPDAGLVAWVVFLVLGGISVFAAIGMTITMSMYRAGLALMLSFLALAGLFFQLGADLVGLVQVMMNVAGMSLMILFMVMLMMDPGGEMMWDMARQMKMRGIGAYKMGMPSGTLAPPGSARDPEAQMMVDMAMSTGQVRWALPISIIVTVALAVVVVRPIWPTTSQAPSRDAVTVVGELLLSKYMIAFEGAALLIVSGIVAAVMLGRRETDDRAVARRATPSVLPADGPRDVPTSERYTCPMHPEVIRDAPGACPKCGMTLELRVAPNADPPPLVVHGGRPDQERKEVVMMTDNADAKTYTCPMHAEVTSPSAGKCPKCGMTLVPKA